MQKSRNVVYSVFVLISLLPYGYFAVETSSLRLVQIIHRHGDRSPTHAYPNDPYQENFWPDGFGQLTKEGKMEMFNLGEYFRRRYVDTGFLSKEYKQTEIEIRSSDKDRTLMSAYLVLAGLYKPQGRQLWDDSVQWQPIPVHTQPLSEDFVIAVECPAYEKLRAEMFLSDRVMKIQEKHRDLIDYVTKQAGLEPTLADLLEVIDPVYCEKKNNLTLPDWLMKDNTAEKIVQLYELKAQLRFSEPALARLKGGPLLGKMLQNMREVFETDQNIPRKAFIFSAHDTTINAFLQALRMFNNKKIPTAAAVFVELHIVENNPLVKILYRNDTTFDPYVLEFSGCATPCPLNTLTSLVKHMIPDDPGAECHGPTVKPRNGVSGTTVAVTALTLVILAVIFGLVLLNTLRVRKRLAFYRYSPVNQHM